ncbi:MAG: oxygen-independent coproporphyrinogen III oxidase [Candidatus Pacearchaeota archaeon]|nr:oxygen-independent coproporphyrinogen III oxidase [Candidatus Pacearchaeota archaeon]
MNNQNFLHIEYLSKRYDETKIPLYLSYPTLTCWKNTADEQNYIENLKNISHPFLYFHFPYCKRACYYCACSKVAGDSPGDIDVYIDHVEKEIELKARYMTCRDMSLTQMHWGGGTPTNMTIKQLRRIHSAITKHFTIIPDESSGISIESYPDETLIDFEKLMFLKEIGFTEISFGIQDFDERVQKSINRDCKFKVVEKIVLNARRAGLRINVDLCYGLPFQEYSGLQNTINKIILLKPDRIALESYSHFPVYYPLQKKIPAASIPNSFMRIILAMMAAELLIDAGYVKIGDHFVIKEHYMHKEFKRKKVFRDFMGYSPDVRKELLAFGSSAISYIGDTYVHNTNNIDHYFSLINDGRLPLDTKVSHKLTGDDKLRAEIIQKGILTYSYIDKGEINDKFNINFDIYFEEEIKKLLPLCKDGIVIMDDRGINIYRYGKYIAKHVALIFDTYY